MVFVSDLKSRLAADLQDAIRERQEPERTVLRAITAAVQNAEIAAGKELDEAALTKLLGKQLKQREESVAAYESRPELAAAEAAEATVIKRYLPEPLSEAELAELVTQAITESGATGPADIGKVMAAVQPKVAGRADGSAIAALVKAKLA